MMLMTGWKRWPIILAAYAAVVSSPYVFNLPGWTPPLVASASLFALTLVGLNVIFGISGMLALGQAAFVALPAYLAMMLMAKGFNQQVSIVLGFAATLGVARLLAALFVRLPGVFFAIGTLAFAKVIEGLARGFPAITGGASGLVIADPLRLGPFTIAGTNSWYVTSIVALTIGLIVFAWLVRGRRLRVWSLVREDELAAEVLGVNVAKTKARVFVLGCAYSAAGGVLSSYYSGVLVPESAGVSASLSQLAVVLIGGAGHLAGPALGAGFLAWLFSVLQGIQRYQILLYGTAFLIMVLYARQGLVGAIKRGTQTIIHHGDLRRHEGSPSADESVANRRAREYGQGMPSGMGLGEDEYTTTEDQPGDGPSEHQSEILVVERISKAFGGLKAVDEVSLKCYAGEILGLIGPNGAGKTTLFNIISGVDRPSSGRITLSGTDITDYSIARRAQMGMGRAFQTPRLVSRLSVMDNVLLGFEIAQGTSEPHRRSLAEAELRRFDVLHLAHQPASELGVGQRKLIELLRAEVSIPSLLLLDEPAVGLTTSELDRLAELLRRLRARGCAILLVEHNVDFVTGVADRALVMDGGSLIASGLPSEVVESPAVREAYFGSI